MITVAPACLAGISIGLAVAAPIGPSAMLCIQRTVQFGPVSGAATGLGIAVVHAAYGMAATLAGAAFLLRESGSFQLLSIASAALLFYFGFRCLRRPVSLPGNESESARKALKFFGSALAFGFANPMTPLIFAAFTPLFIPLQAPVGSVALGIFAGSLGWWLSLSTAVTLLRSRLSARVLSALNVSCGLLLETFAVVMMARAFGWPPSLNP